MLYLIYIQIDRAVINLIIISAKLCFHTLDLIANLGQTSLDRYDILHRLSLLHQFQQPVLFREQRLLMTFQIHILQRHIRHILRAALHIGLLPDILQKSFQILPRYPHRHSSVTKIFRSLIILGIFIPPAKAGHFLYVTAKCRDLLLDRRQQLVELFRLYGKRHILDQFPVGGHRFRYFRTGTPLFAYRFFRILRLGFRRIESAAGIICRCVAGSLLICIHPLAACTAASGKRCHHQSRHQNDAYIFH